MKQLAFLTALILITLWGCSDDSGGGSTGTSGSSMNPGGKYNGAWLLYSSHSYEYNEITYVTPPDEKFYDIDSGTDIMTDTNVILVLKGDSANRIL